jgi:hypothetical protein
MKINGNIFSGYRIPKPDKVNNAAQKLTATTCNGSDSPSRLISPGHT